MKNLTIRVRREREVALEASKQDATRGWNGEPSENDTEYFTYPSVTRLFEQLAPDCWEVVETL